MSIPWCGPCGRGEPKSFVNSTLPSTGKTICLPAGFGFGLIFGGGFGSGGRAAADPAARPKRARMRSKRAVVRVLTMGRRSAKCGTLPGVSEGFTASFPSLESLLMKIAVCVKEVPDAAVHKRIDPETKRLDRSGEGTLNHFDTQAVEEALRIKEAQNEGEVV